MKNEEVVPKELGGGQASAIMGGIVEFSPPTSGNDYVLTPFPHLPRNPFQPLPERSVNPPRTRGAREGRGLPCHERSRPGKALIHPF